MLGAQLAFKNLSFEVKLANGSTKKILKDVSGIIKGAMLGNRRHRRFEALLARRFVGPFRTTFTSASRSEHTCILLDAACVCMKVEEITHDQPFRWRHDVHDGSQWCWQVQSTGRAG